jgi:tetratricopeptide (TPR) repeat protein
MRKRESEPINWANSEYGLARAYSNRVLGNRADNLEKAIVAVQAVLSIQTREAMPQEWANNQIVLGNALASRINGNRADNAEKAISAYQAALSVRSRAATPDLWAVTEMSLGNAYRNRVQGNRADNMEKAIESYMAALTTSSHDTSPLDWAAAQVGLGLAFWSRVRGSPADNYERAITAYQAGLTVYSAESTSENWAITENDLGLAYKARLSSDRAKNLELAIASYQLALQFRARGASPQGWAQTEANLCAAFVDRVLGERSENVKRAITHCSNAISIYKKDKSPLDWARTTFILGKAYELGSSGDMAGRAKALDCYAEALKTQANQNSPFEALEILTSIIGIDSQLALRTEKTDKQIDSAYATSMKMIDDLIGDGLDSQQIEYLMTRAGGLYSHAALRAIDHLDYKEALAISVKGRARVLSIAINIDFAERGLTDFQRERLLQLRQGLQNLEMQLIGSDSSLLGNEGITTDPIAFGDRQQSLRDNISELRLQLRAILPAIKPPNLVNTTILVTIYDDNRGFLLGVTEGVIDAIPLQHLSGKTLQ